MQYTTHLIIMMETVKEWTPSSKEQTGFCQHVCQGGDHAS